MLATDAGKAVVDSGAAASQRRRARGAGELPGGRVTTLFNTHWHLDQVGSNDALGSAGATIIAHEKTRLRLQRGLLRAGGGSLREGAAARPGRRRRSTRTTRPTIGDRRIEYGYLLEAHTDGDIYVSFPTRTCIAVGDVVSPQRDPVLDWFGGGWLGGRVDALARLLELSDRSTRFVPSYGPVVGRAEVQAEHDMMLKLFERMVEHVRHGEMRGRHIGGGCLGGWPRTFEDPSEFLYDVHKGFWAHHNKLMPDVV